MVGAAVDSSLGMTIVFGTSGFTGELLSLSHGGISRESIDTSHMGIAAPAADKFGNMTSIPGDLSDPGELTFEIHLDTGQVGVTKQPPIDQATETITITFPKASGDGAAATWAASGYVTDFEMSADLDDKVTASVTVKFTGNVTVTAATT